MQSSLALYPGKFKPFTGGHYSIVKKYLESPNIDELIVVISRKDKEGFKAEDSLNFIKLLFKDYISSNKLEVVISDVPSPVGYCYDYVSKLIENSNESDLYKICLVSSSKNDDIERVNYFEKSFMPGGKYEDPHILVFDPKISVDPLTYIDRKDLSKSGFKTGDPISGTAARADIIHNDFQDFKSNYPQKEFENPEMQSLLKDYFKDCQETLKSQGLSLNEGGAAGHMSHIVDVNDFSFSDYKNIIHGVLTNKFSMSEKVDGLNCFISYRSDDNQFVVARNKTHLRGNPLTLEELPAAFSTPIIGQIYYVACKELARFLSQIKEDTLNKIFNNTETWLNFEIIDSKFSNIISYQKSLIILHNFQNYTDDSKSLSDSSEHTLEYIQKLIDKTDMSGYYFKIGGPILLKINSDSNTEISNLIKEKEKEFISDLNKIESRFNLSDESTMEDYMYSRLDQLLDDNAIKVESSIYNNLLNRWVNSDKSIRINNLLKDIDSETKQKIAQIDKEFNKISSKLKSPIHNVFVHLGDFILLIISNLVNSNSSDSDKSKKRISDRLDSVKNSLSPEDLDKYSDAFKNISSINPSEGITFTYKGNLLKLTGSFYYINKVFHVGEDGIFGK